MIDYLALTYSSIVSPGDTPKADGVVLASDCLRQLRDLNNPKRFPPPLLILLTSPEYLEPEKADYKEMPLISSSVASVFCNQVVYPKGALLICLASRPITVRVAVSKQVQQDPAKSISRLLTELECDSVGQEDQNPSANRLLLTFLHGFKSRDDKGFYLAPELYQLLRANVPTGIQIIGGVCSAGDIRRAKQEVLYE